MRRLLISLIAVSTLISVVQTPAGAIVGGRPASRPYPYMASVQNLGSDRHGCGGTLIRKDVVLTAAHCIDWIGPPLQVMIGSQKLSEPGDVIPVKRIKVHENYVYDDFGGHPAPTYDVALLFLSKPASQRPIRIAAASERDLWEPGDRATLIGWGQDKVVYGSWPDQLQEAEVPIADDQRCGLMYPEQVWGYDPETVLCTGDDVTGDPSCYGDSGGPLMVKTRTGRFVQVGVSSWGLANCGKPVFYAVYARVADTELRAWIERNSS